MSRAHVAVFFGVVSAAALTAIETPALGQSRTGFAVDRYEPAERGSGWFVVDGLDLRGRARPALGVTLDYAYKPLAVFDRAQNERMALVRHQLFAHVGGSLVLANRFRLGANVPLAIYQDGEAARIGGQTHWAATDPAFGDVRLAADMALVGRYEDPIAIAVGVRAWIPTGLRSQFTSDGAVRLSPQLLVSGNVGAFRWAARGAFVYRAREDAYAGSPLGSELVGAIGLGLRFGKFLLGPELFASTGLDGDAFLQPRSTPADAVLGVHYHLSSGLQVSAALGSGLSRGYGSPTLRALLSVEWGTPIPAAPADSDHDGILDVSDACSDVPGVPSGDPEMNGCPPLERVPDEDTDGDAIWDREDACPAVVGIRTTDPMTNGCPVGAPRQLAVVTSNEIRIGEEVRFETGSAELVPESDAVLAAVKRLLDEHPEIRKVQVEGHTDTVGDPAYNEELSQRRAASVVRWLVDRGIDGSRLESMGYGSRRPIDTNASDEGRAKNRRVVFTIVERDRSAP